MKKLNVKNQRKFNQWTVALAAVGVVSLASAARADEKMSMVQTALSNTTIGGYVDTAATWRPGTDQNAAGGPNIPAYSFSKNDGFSLNAIDIALDHPEDESPWAAGYHVEFMLGQDAVPGAGIRTAYLTLRTPVGNGIDWKIGVWDTIIGYESSSDPLNPNYTRSYGYSIEPTTHTGILGTYKVNDMVTVQAGVADGSNVGTPVAAINGTSATESQKTYMGDLQLTAPDSAGFMKGATLTLGAINCVDSATATGHAPGTTSFYAGTTLPTPIAALKVGAAFDYLDIHDSGPTNPGNDSMWVVGLYTTYQATDKLSFNLRGEYMNNGEISAASNISNPLAPVNTAYALNQVEELTATVQYQLWANVLSRVEFRWDHVEHGNAFGQAEGAPVSTPNRANDFLLALNVIYQF